MIPSTSIYDSGNRSFVHFVFLTKLIPQFRFCPPYFSDLNDRKLSISNESLTTLLNHVGRIVFGSSKKQMIRIHARWIVAMVKNKHSFWYGASVKYPTCSMGGYLARFFARRNIAIPVPIFSASPSPAFWSFLNLAKKSFGKCVVKLMFVNYFHIATIQRMRKIETT